MSQKRFIKLFNKIACLSFIVVFSFTGIYAQNTGEEYLNSLQNKFNTIKDLTANVDQTINGKSSLSAKIFFKKENNIRLEFGNSTIVSDGVSSWNYNKKENKVIISDYEEDGSLFSINFLVYQFPAQCTLKGEQDGNLRKLTLAPKSKTANLGEVTLWINKEDLIEKIQTNDHANRLIELKFSNIKTNQNLSNSNFQFSPPQGSKVIDLR